MAKMSKKWAVLCSTAIAAVYAAGYFTTETQASVQPPQQIQVNNQESSDGQPNDGQSDTVSTDSVTTNAQPTQQMQVNTQASDSHAKAASTASESQAKAASTDSSKTKTNAQPSKQIQVNTNASAGQSKGGTVSTATQKTNSRYKDGTFTGMGSNRRGSIQVAVNIKNDKITDVEISDFGMHYSERDVEGLPQEVLQKQSASVRNVSGATYSTRAFEDAVRDALSQAARNA